MTEQTYKVDENRIYSVNDSQKFKGIEARFSMTS